MVGAEHVDQVPSAPQPFGPVVGDVGGEVGVGAVGLEQRPVDLVTEERRAEEGLLTVLPVVLRLALRRRQRSDMDEIAIAQVPDRLGHEIAVRAGRERPLREEAVVPHAEQPEVLADQLHHRPHGRVAEWREPFGLRPTRMCASVPVGERLPDRDEVLAG